MNGRVRIFVIIILCFCLGSEVTKTTGVLEFAVPFATFPGLVPIRPDFIKLSVPQENLPPKTDGMQMAFLWNRRFLTETDRRPTTGGTTLDGDGKRFLFRGGTTRGSEAGISSSTPEKNQNLKFSDVFSTAIAFVSQLTLNLPARYPWP